jgi:hypothetical protein
MVGGASCAAAGVESCVAEREMLGGSLALPPPDRPQGVRDGGRELFTARRGASTASGELAPGTGVKAGSGARLRTWFLGLFELVKDNRGAMRPSRQVRGSPAQRRGRGSGRLTGVLDTHRARVRAPSKRWRWGRRAELRHSDAPRTPAVRGFTPSWALGTTGS